jgi:hypothetical protein
VLFPFNGELMCFIHVLLNGLDMKAKGWDARIVVEGAACKLVPELAKSSNPMHGLWAKAKAAGIVEGACKACSAKLGVLEGVQAEGLTLLDDMSGHPSMSRFIEEGYSVITF